MESQCLLCFVWRFILVEMSRCILCFCSLNMRGILETSALASGSAGGSPDEQTRTFLFLSYVFRMLLQCFPCGFLMFFPMVSLSFSYVFPILSYAFVCVPNAFLMLPHLCSYGCLVLFFCFSYAFLLLFFCLPYAFLYFSYALRLFSLCLFHVLPSFPLLFLCLAFVFPSIF